MCSQTADDFQGQLFEFKSVAARSIGSRVGLMFLEGINRDGVFFSFAKSLHINLSHDEGLVWEM